MTATATSTTSSRWTRIVLAILGIVVLSSCRVDIVLDVTVEPDGTGTMSITATADAEVIQRVPTIADDLVLDDIVDAGWVVDGPTPTPEGGLVITFTHPFEGADEATNLLRSLGPPFSDPELRRGESGDVTTNTFTGKFGLPDGFASFADDELISAVGGVPFDDEFAAAGATPAGSITAAVRASLPGEILDDGTNGNVTPDGRLEWTVPIDGSILELSARAEQAPSAGGSWARPLSIVALIALIGWVAFMTVFIGYVTVARWRRSRRYRRRAV